MSVRGTLGQRGPVGPAALSASLVQAVALAFNFQIPDNVQILVLNPSLLLALGTLVLPANPIDGQVIEVSSTQTITVLTVSASQTIRGGGAITIGATTGLSWRYIQSIDTWMRRY